jgi:hypothetical protein
MDSVARFRNHRSPRKRSGLLCFACFALSITVACARQEPLHSESADSANAETLPFHSDSRVGENEDARPVLPSNPKSAVAPFYTGQSRILPVGTLLTVQVTDSLYAAKVHAGDSFTATLADPLMVDGKMVASSGIIVTGSIEAAKSAMKGSLRLGYFQLTLNTISLKGRALEIHTSSLFARATADAARTTMEPATVRISKGRRLTFRLTSPLTLAPDGQTLQG